MHPRGEDSSPPKATEPFTLPAVPTEPARTATTPTVETDLMTWFNVSATHNSPLSPTVTPLGWLKPAA